MEARMRQDRSSVLQGTEQSLDGRSASSRREPARRRSAGLRARPILLLASLLLAACGGAPEDIAAQRQRETGPVAQLLEEGTAELQSGDALAALEKLRLALERDPRSAEAHIRMGAVFRRLAMYDRARAEYERALELGGPRADLYQNLGVVEAKSNRFRAAAQNFERAIDLDPERAELHHNLGKAYEEQARFDEALGAFERALRLDPADLESAAALGNLLIMKGRSRRAIEILIEALKHSPDHAHACYQLGLAFLNEAQPGHAVEHLQRAVRSDPSLKGAWLNLGRAAEAAGREALSHEAYERFSSLYEQERQKEADKNRLAQRIEREVPARHERAVELSTEGRYQEAIRELEAILELQPNDARTLTNVGRLYETLENGSRARIYLKRAVAADPTYVDPQLDLARLERAAGKAPQALAGAERVLGLEPDHGPAWLLRGIALAELGRWAESAAALEEAARRLPDRPEPYQWLSRVYRKLGRPQDAERAAERATSASAKQLQAGGSGAPP